MPNSGRRRVNYTPRMTDEQAYEVLHPAIRKALQDGVNDWSAYAALRHSRKHGWKATVDWLRAADEFFMRKGWEPARGKRAKVESPSIAVHVPPLRANWFTGMEAV